jgi:hypothetical protein
MCTIMAWETREGIRILEQKPLITDWEYIRADLLATLAVTPLLVGTNTPANTDITVLQSRRAIQDSNLRVKILTASSTLPGEEEI